MLCIKYISGVDAEIVDLDTIPQILIEYNPNDETLEEFIKRHQEDQHIYIDIAATYWNDFLQDTRFPILKDKYNNWSVIIPFRRDIEILKSLCHYYIFSDRVENWEDLQEVLNLGVKEVYITNELCFDLLRVKKECDRRDVKLRAVANVAQCHNQASTPPIKTFFIRPEDIDFYNKYLHGIEFYGGANIQQICYKAYSRGYWWGDLSELIIGLGTSLDDRRLPSNFGSLRTICEKRCIKGGGCGVCRTMMNFTKVMEKTDSIIQSVAKE